MFAITMAMHLFGQVATTANPVAAPTPEQKAVAFLSPRGAPLVPPEPLLLLP